MTLFRAAGGGEPPDHHDSQADDLAGFGHLQAPHPQVPDLQLADPQLADHRSPDHQPPHGDHPQRDRPHLPAPARRRTRHWTRPAAAPVTFAPVALAGTLVGCRSMGSLSSCMCRLLQLGRPSGGAIRRAAPE